MPIVTVSCVYKSKQRSVQTFEVFLIGFFDAELKNKPVVLMQLHQPSHLKHVHVLHELLRQVECNRQNSVSLLGCCCSVSTDS